MAFSLRSAAVEAKVAAFAALVLRLSVAQHMSLGAVAALGSTCLGITNGSYAQRRGLQTNADSCAVEEGSIRPSGPHDIMRWWVHSPGSVDVAFQLMLESVCAAQGEQMRLFLFGDSSDYNGEWLDVIFNHDVATLTFRENKWTRFDIQSVVMPRRLRSKVWTTFRYQRYGNGDVFVAVDDVALAFRPLTTNRSNHSLLPRAMSLFFSVPARVSQFQINSTNYCPDECIPRDVVQQERGCDHQCWSSGHVCNQDPKRKQTHEDMFFCQMACLRSKQQKVSLWHYMFGAVVLGLLLAFTTHCSLRLLQLGRCVSGACGALVFLLALLLSALPLWSHYPHLCADVQFTVKRTRDLGLQVYPLLVVGTSASLAGLVVATVCQCLHRRTAIGRVSFSYFLLAASFNAVGLVGALHLSCQRNWFLGLPLSMVWLAGSFLTNLVLQKLVLMRAAFLDNSKRSALMARAFYVEVGAALVLGVSLCILSVMPNSLGEMNVTSVLILACIGSSSFVLVFGDLIFSIVSCLIMYTAVLKLSGQRRLAVDLPRTSLGAPFATDSLARALFLCRVNMALVTLSMFSTSVLYAGLVGTSAVTAMDKQLADHGIALLYIAWLMDSLFNDICVIYIGFGQTAEALMAVRDAATSPAAIVNDPTQGAATHVIGRRESL